MEFCKKYTQSGYYHKVIDSIIKTAKQIDEDFTIANSNSSIYIKLYNVTLLRISNHASTGSYQGEAGDIYPCLYVHNYKNLTELKKAVKEELEKQLRENSETEEETSVRQNDFERRWEEYQRKIKAGENVRFDNIK